MKYALNEIMDKIKPYGNEDNDDLSFNIIDKNDGTQTLYVKNVNFYDKDKNVVIRGDMEFPNFIIDEPNGELLVDYTNNEKKLFEIYLPDGEKWE